MRRQCITSIVISMCLTTLVATAVNAQSSQRFEVNIPFQFISNGRTLPSGKYVVERIDSTKRNIVMLRNRDEGTVQLIITQRVEKENPSRASSLVFLRREGKSYLYQIWSIGDSNGNEVPPTNENEKRVRGITNSSLVRLRANGP